MCIGNRLDLRVRFFNIGSKEAGQSENSLGRDNDAVETDSKGYHSGESESSTGRPSNNKDTQITV